MDLSPIRKEYGETSLSKESLHSDPLEQFHTWFQEALATGIVEANAFTLATTSREGKPSSRTILLKSYDERGFVFYTNYESRKALEMKENPFASATFFWKEMHRQVNVEGKVEKISQEESEKYFAKRPRGAQLGAWASPQDRVIPSRATLEEEYQRLDKLYAKKEIPLPPFWGGFRFIPTQYEFWQGRENRLHDRFRYHSIENQWKMERLSP